MTTPLPNDHPPTALIQTAFYAQYVLFPGYMFAAFLPGTKRAVCNPV